MDNVLPNLNSVEFNFNEIEKFPFPEESARKWILAIIQAEDKIPGELNFIFCSDEFLLDINTQYLNHDTLTDIITFDYSEDFGNVSGDIYISTERVLENAEIFQASFFQELFRVIAHGVLHIIGYKDKTDEEREKMRDKENYYLSTIDFL